MGNVTLPMFSQVCPKSQTTKPYNIPSKNSIVYSGCDITNVAAGINNTIPEGR